MSIEHEKISKEIIEKRNSDAPRVQKIIEQAPEREIVDVLETTNEQSIDTLKILDTIKDLIHDLKNDLANFGIADFIKEITESEINSINKRKKVLAQGIETFSNPIFQKSPNLKAKYEEFIAEKTQLDAKNIQQYNDVMRICESLCKAHIQICDILTITIQANTEALNYDDLKTEIQRLHDTCQRGLDTCSEIFLQIKKALKHITFQFSESDPSDLISLIDIDKMQQKINKLTTILKAEEKTKKHNLSDYLTRLCERVSQSFFGTKELYTKVEAEGEIAATDHQIEQIFTNLVFNAAKYGGDKEKVDIQINTQNHPERLIVQVINNTPHDEQGISSKLLQNGDLFKHGVSGKGSSGHGLFAVKKYVKQLNGDISVESIPGKTTFEIQFQKNNQ